MAVLMLKGVAGLAGVGTGAVIFDVYSRKVSKEQSFSDAFKHYAIIRGMGYMGKQMFKKLDRDTYDLTDIQESLLERRIKDCKNTAYGIDHNFNDIETREDFVQIHPLTRYDHYKPYIQRIAKGEENVMSKDRPSILALTSGTSGQSSMIPMLPQQSSFFFAQGIAALFHLMLNAFPGMANLQKDLKFFYTPQERVSEGGIPVGPNSSSPKNSKGALHMYSTPLSGFDILDEPSAQYVHLLFALKDQNLGIIEANFASLIYNGFRALEQSWEQLVTDIENGKVSEHLKISEEIRANLNKLLKADPERAAQLRQEFEKGFDGIAKRIWRKCYLILCVDTGSFDLYGKYLREKVCKGIPLYSPLYAATEGLIGLNIDPLAGKREYLLVPRAMFFEFIPISETENDQPRTLFMDQVKQNEVYELVITNLSGLFRYRFGDVVRISGFYNECPKVQFLYRQGQLLNVRGEKTSERTFYGAVLGASKKWGQKRLVDYCCVDSVVMDTTTGKKTTCPQYHVFVELEDGEKLNQEEEAEVDRTLCEQSFVYDSFRKKNSISAMQVYTVQKGTFQKLRQLMVQHTDATSNQFKVPRVVRKSEAVNLMLNHVLH